MSAAKRRKISLEAPDIPTAGKKSVELHNRCLAEKDVGEEFTLQELEAFKIAADHDELRGLCQELLDKYCFVPYSRRGVTIYKTRAKELALK
jgi:hypothetical protein